MNVSRRWEEENHCTDMLQECAGLTFGGQMQTSHPLLTVYDETHLFGREGGAVGVYLGDALLVAHHFTICEKRLRIELSPS